MAEVHRHNKVPIGIFDAADARNHHEGRSLISQRVKSINRLSAWLSAPSVVFFKAPDYTIIDNFRKQCIRVFLNVR